jgi:hypothetical protein
LHFALLRRLSAAVPTVILAKPPRWNKIKNPSLDGPLDRTPVLLAVDHGRVRLPALQDDAVDDHIGEVEGAAHRAAVHQRRADQPPERRRALAPRGGSAAATRQNAVSLVRSKH